MVNSGYSLIAESGCGSRSDKAGFKQLSNANSRLILNIINRLGPSNSRKNVIRHEKTHGYRIDVAFDNQSHITTFGGKQLFCIGGQSIFPFKKSAEPWELRWVQTP